MADFLSHNFLCNFRRSLVHFLTLCQRQLSCQPKSAVSTVWHKNRIFVLCGSQKTKRPQRLKAENEALKSKPQRAVTLKVSEKGAVSVYGLGRFPVTLYKGQWTKLLDLADDIRTFIRENDGKLKSKE